MENKDSKIEDKFGALDKIVDELEGENVSLEDSFNLYKKGVTLLKECSESIDKVEKQLIILNEDGVQDEL